MQSIHLSFPLILLATLTLSGCGFQLRGVTEVPPELSPMYVKAPRNARTANTLKAALHANGVAMTASAEDARTTVRILNEEEDSRVTAVNSQGKVIGTELELKVVFDAVGGDGRTLAKRQVIELAREYINPDVQVLGKSEEARLIREDMRRDMADRILHRLKAQLLN